MKLTRLSSVACVSVLIAFVLSAELPHTAFAQADPQLGDPATALADLDRRLEEAAVKGDADFLERHLGDDLSVTHDGGAKETKSDWVLRAKRIPNRYFFAREVSNQAVDIHGNVALVVGRLDIRGFGLRGDPTKTPPDCFAIEYVHVYALRNNQWTLVSNRTTHMVEQSHPCDSLVGIWTLNLAKSTFEPGPAPRSETVTYEKVGDGVKRTVETVRADGNRDTRAYTAKYDGKDYPDIGPNFDTIAVTRIDAWTVDETVKKAGRVVYTARQVVSKDGRVITTTVTGTNASGQPMHNVRVLDKQ